MRNNVKNDSAGEIAVLGTAKDIRRDKAKHIFEKTYNAEHALRQNKAWDAAIDLIERALLEEMREWFVEEAGLFSDATSKRAWKSANVAVRRFALATRGYDLSGEG